MATKDMVVPLYLGNHVITYRNGNHRYYEGSEVVPSVTTILGAVLAKPDLMLWPLNEALKYLTDKLPNITADDLNLARSAHMRKRETGANTGTAVHYLIEQRLRMPFNRRLDLDIDTLPEDVVVAATAFETWYITKKPTVISVEQIIYSPTLHYGGTYDSILQIGGKTYLCDVKTSNPSKFSPLGIYAEHFAQLGAYYHAYQEQRLWEMKHGKTMLTKIDDLMVISVKKNGVVDTVSASSVGYSLPHARQLWKAVMAIYQQMNSLKKSLSPEGAA